MAALAEKLHAIGCVVPINEDREAPLGNLDMAIQAELGIAFRWPVWNHHREAKQAREFGDVPAYDLGFDHERV